MTRHLTDIILTVSTKEPLDEEAKDFVTGALEYLASLIDGEPEVIGVSSENDDGETFHFVRAERDRLAEQITAVRELHILYTDHRELQWCYHCETPWPCPTIQALEGE